MTRRAVFLDRDGVLNRALVRDGRPYPPRDVAEAELLPGALLACQALKAAGATLVMVTNQPDLGRGTTTPATVAAINSWLQEALSLDDVRVCPHEDADGCGCRKPLPGMLVDAAAELAVDLAGSVMVGDRWRDVDAGRAAGCATVFVNRDYAERRPEQPDLVVRELGDAVPWILERLCEEQAP